MNPLPLVTASELEHLYHHVIEHRPAVQRGRGVMHSGAFASAFRGHGLEMADVRPYQWGDDLRHMDWRATARSGKPTTKVFVDERLRSVFVAVDRGPTMAFGTRGQVKAALAARVAAIWTFTALANHESAGGVVHDRETRFFPVARTLDGALPLLHRAAAPLPPWHDSHPAAPDMSLKALLHHTHSAAPPQSSVCLISDFTELNDAHLPALLQLAEQRAVMAIHIEDPAEHTLPRAGVLRMISPVTGRRYTIDTADEALRARYAEAMAERRAAATALFSRAGIPRIPLSTDHDPLQQLAQTPWAMTL